MSEKFRRLRIWGQRGVPLTLASGLKSLLFVAAMCLLAVLVMGVVLGILPK